MKPRKVFVTLEIETDAPVNELRTITHWEFYGEFNFMKITEKPKVSIAQPVKKKA